jgi:hypothetical protein
MPTERSDDESSARAEAPSARVIPPGGRYLARRGCVAELGLSRATALALAELSGYEFPLLVPGAERETPSGQRQQRSGACALSADRSERAYPTSSAALVKCRAA